VDVLGRAIAESGGDGALVADSATNAPVAEETTRA
jgi:hypothetical protein